VDRPRQALKIEKENISIFAKKKKVMRDLSKPLSDSKFDKEPKKKKTKEEKKVARREKLTEIAGGIAGAGTLGLILLSKSAKNKSGVSVGK
jgi:ferric-dicitrate binding protein FerR (iron transport regulator)